MAKIIEQRVVITLSRIVKDSADEIENLVNQDFKENVEAVVQELVGSSVVVEIQEAD